jgi:hypothetical protein
VSLGKATTRQHAAQQRAVWRASVATRRKGDYDIGCVVAIDNTTRKVFQISHHTNLPCYGNIIMYAYFDIHLNEQVQ